VLLRQADAEVRDPVALAGAHHPIPARAIVSLNAFDPCEIEQSRPPVAPLEPLCIRIAKLGAAVSVLAFARRIRYW
jgi:hypothetical protein